jgi:diguanylate cyclase (GGDEF)-like protein/PAS domain S-box-containing protein
MLFASNPDPMWMYDPATLDFLQANQAAVQQYGYTEEEFRSIDLLAIVEAGHDADLLAGLRETGPQQLTGPWKHRRKDGSFFQVDMASQPVLLEGRRVTFALMQDVTERERLHAQLLRQAQHDVLTDLANRDLFEQRFTDFVQRATRSRRRAAIFCFDLDRFKQINDSYGHSAGDACLKEVSLRMHQLVAQRGIVCRSGGDEFLISLSDLASVQEAEQFASELLRSLTNPLQLQGGEFEMGASIGFAIYPDDGTDQALLWRDADAAMYQAKRGGGAHWVRVSHEISSSASEASEIEFALRRALKSGNFEVHYQPLVGLDGSLHSFEALLRSPDPLLRSVPTDRIIAIAEVSGMIVPVGNWVLEEVCRQFRAWMDAGVAPERIAVNVSPLQLMRFDFSRHVAATLERFRLNARVLEFEVTESTVMPDRGFDVPHQIRTLARMGIRFSADDFGTGYSSLGRLHQLPVDELKIDRSFIQRIAEDNGTYPTVQAIIVLAHTFGMKVVAEGVETEEQVSLLRDLKCDLLQGFLFGRPLPSRMTTELLRQRIAA